MYTLKSTYSIDLVSDLKKIHGVSVEKELERLLQYEIDAELKRENIDPNKVTVVRRREGNTVFFDAVWSE